MKRKTGKVARFKLQRRLLTELPGLGKAGALERRPYPPGQHGGKRIKYSDFRLQLEEKQKVRFHYGLREEQLLRVVQKAKATSEGKWIDKLINLLERRLDNLVFRAGFAPSIPAAKQLISHGKILVNGKKLDISSAILKVQDKVELKASDLSNQVYLQAKQVPRLPLPDWMEKTESDSNAFFIVKDEPNLDSAPFAFDPSLVTSYYSM